MIRGLPAPVVPRSVIPLLGSHGFQLHAVPTSRSLTHWRPDRVASLPEEAPLPMFTPERADGGWTCDDEV